jgi:hypothetical protein
MLAKSIIESQPLTLLHILRIEYFLHSFLCLGSIEWLPQFKFTVRPTASWTRLPHGLPQRHMSLLLYCLAVISDNLLDS